MKTHVIQLERFDDVISTKDRISWAKAPRVLLVWPRRGRIMRNMPDLVLLERYCRRLGAQLALVTWDDVVAQNADALGIPMYESVERAQSVSWRRSSKRPASSLTRRISKGNSFQDLRRQARPELSPGINWFTLPVRLAFFLIGIGAVVVLCVFLLPSAVISLDFPSSTQDLELEIWTSPEITSASISGGIPAYPVSVSVEGNDDIRSTGMLSFPLATAEGIVRFTNLTEDEITVPVGTVVLTFGEPGIRFVTTRPVLLPAGIGEKADTSVQAIVAGTSGNVESGTITAIEGDLGLKLMVENPEPISGGADQNEPSPTETDATKLRDTLLNQLQVTAVSELSTMLSPEQRILMDHVMLQEILEEVYEPALDQPADRLRLTMRAVFSGLYYQQNDVESFAELSLNANLSQRFAAVPGTFKVVEMEKPIRDDTQRSHWRVHASRQIQEQVDENSIKDLVAGKDPQAVIQQLDNYLNLESTPEIVLSPAWWPRLPYFFMRIKVVER